MAWRSEETTQPRYRVCQDSGTCQYIWEEGLTIYLIQAWRGAQRTAASLTTDAPSSTGTLHHASERVAGPSGSAQRALPKLVGKSVVISGGSQVRRFLWLFPQPRQKDCVNH